MLITATTLSALGEHFSPQQVLDLIALYGMYLTLGSMIKTFGIELDLQVVKRLPAAFIEKDFHTP